MKRTILLAVLLYATATWADNYTVSSDSELRTAIQNNGASITVTADIDLSNGTLKGGWGGHAGGLSNESGTVNLTNVNITGCKGDDNGGGICNLGGTLTMTGGSITNARLFFGDEDASGIETMENGRGEMSDVRCKMSDVWLDLSGRKLSGKPTQKGIYIYKGKKVKR